MRSYLNIGCDNTHEGPIMRLDKNTESQCSATESLESGVESLESNQNIAATNNKFDSKEVSQFFQKARQDIFEV